MAGGNFRAELDALRCLAAHNGPHMRLADADNPVGTTVAALLIHLELLVVEGVDDQQAFVPVGCQVAKAGSVVQLPVDVAEVAFDVSELLAAEGQVEVGQFGLAIGAIHADGYATSARNIAPDMRNPCIISNILGPSVLRNQKIPDKSGSPNSPP
jgi:hypothetical protein